MRRDKMIRELESIATSHGHVLGIWIKGRWGFHNVCCNCGAFVAFTASTGKIRSDLENIKGSCPGGEAIRGL